MTEPRAPRTLLEEIHERSLWQVLIAYLGVSWAVLEAVALFSERYGLPGWLFSTALGLLACGLLVVVVAGLFGASSGDSGDRVRGRSVAPGSTWGRAGLALLAACATWGVIATAALISSRGETQALLTRGEVLGTLERFADERQWDSAFALSRAYEQDLAADSAFAAVRERVSRAVDRRSLPSGAAVWWQEGTEIWATDAFAEHFYKQYGTFRPTAAQMVRLGVAAPGMPGGHSRTWR